MTDSLIAPEDRLRIVVAQINPALGDIAGNAARMRAVHAEAARQEADLVVFPELSLSGAPLLALARDPAFLAACRAEVEVLARETQTGPALLVGAPWADGGRIHNAMLLLEAGQIRTARFKVAPEAGFDAGPMPGPIPFRDTRIGLAIGADLDAADVCECLSETGAELLIAPLARPHAREDRDARLSAVVARVVETGLPLLLVNAVGGQEDRVCDGGSLALGTDRRLAMQFPLFLERVRISEWQRFETGWRCLAAPAAEGLDGPQADYAALLLGLRDRVRKGGFSGVVLDLSAGPEARFAALLAVDALGAGAVHGLLSAPDDDGAALAEALGIAVTVTHPAPLAAALEQAPFGGMADAAALAGLLLEGAARATGALALAPASRTALFAGHLPAGAFNPLADLTSPELAALADLRARWMPPEAKGPAGLVLALPTRPDADPLPQAEAARRRAPPGLRLTGRVPAGAPLFPITTQFKTEG
ncbi:MAG: hypothetical protein B7X99_20000 [Rhizobiales bacterium 17-65-6]|nr:MAG: hypothetical protein B7X99_20000 [Rhizobiales bacterium 17-65-6]